MGVFGTLVARTPGLLGSLLGKSCGSSFGNLEVLMKVEPCGRVGTLRFSRS